MITNVIKSSLLVSLLIAGTPASSAESSEDALSSYGLTADELNLENPAYMDPIPASEVKEVKLDGIVEFGYQDADGRYVVDILEQNKAYLGVKITTPEGRPVVGAMPNIEIEGTSRLELSDFVSAEDGVMNFGLITGQMGLDTVTASIGDAKVEFAVNIISLRAAGFPQPQEVEGGIPWSDLMSAKLDYSEAGLTATFPQSIQAMAGETVKISGFMMPLQPDLKQTHFLLTSNPPSCFFHIPGGPAGSVEVVAAEGIEVSWDPVVLEGTFEPQESSNIGVVYRLVDAKVVGG